MPSEFSWGGERSQIRTEGHRVLQQHELTIPEGHRVLTLISLPSNLPRTPSVEFFFVEKCTATLTPDFQ